ncbi:FHA domain-containing protein [Myxosarcina sp. GI1]|uniref:FHA domain-containing protein n=1 Tax=Myxosarcina sp. GI1 TaxID=1541065 RepID=UPI0005611A6B|nr:FHA domain-containing protein [Myxosarcina sp. GI1]
MTDPKSKLNLVKFNRDDALQGRHILIVESSESKRAVSLNVSVFSIGRHPQNNLPINDKMVSRHHATIAWMRYIDDRERSHYAFWIIDGKGKRKRSSNGIFINGKRQTLHKLNSGDVISLGNNIKITYQYIPHNPENDKVLQYWDREKTHYTPVRDTNYKDTMVLDNSEIEETVLSDNYYDS